MSIINMAELDLANKRVLIRVDFNVPVKDQKVTSDARIRAAIPTIKLALDGGARLMLMSHRGRPVEGDLSEQDSMQPIANHLASLLGKDVPLVTDYLNGVEVAAGEIVLFENVRGNVGEKSNDPELSKKLAALCDIFVNDAFGTAHRAHASTHGVAQFAPLACAGLLLAGELEALAKALDNPARPMVAIVGGSKVSTKLTVLDTLMDKVDQLIRTVDSVVFRHTFTDLLMSDTCGRISDDMDDKIAASKEWVETFLRREPFPTPDYNREDDQPALIMPIAPSGSGKSTFVRDKANVINNDRPFVHYSWDDLRHKWYGDDYVEAFRLSCEDKEFKRKVQAEFNTLIKARSDVLVDNINTSKKSRRFFLTEAKRHGYYTIAVLLPCDVQNLVCRQQTRDDKTVPADVVRRQYMSMQYPSYGEFDEIRIMDSNLT